MLADDYNCSEIDKVRLLPRHTYNRFPKFVMHVLGQDCRRRSQNPK
jgi:hypothetical protein